MKFHGARDSRSGVHDMRRCSGAHATPFPQSADHEPPLAIGAEARWYRHMMTIFARSNRGRG